MAPESTLVPILYRAYNDSVLAADSAVEEPLQNFICRHLIYCRNHFIQETHREEIGKIKETDTDICDRTIYGHRFLSVCIVSIVCP